MNINVKFIRVIKKKTNKILIIKRLISNKIVKKNKIIKFTLKIFYKELFLHLPHNLRFINHKIKIKLNFYNHNNILNIITL